MPDRVMDLRALGDEFVIHYGGRLNEIDAYTFANSLVSLANSMRATNALINPGHEIEIAIQALGAGSFRAKIRATKRTLKNLFSLTGAGTGILGGLLVVQIWDATHPRQPPTIVVNDDSVVFKYDDATIILPRGASEAYQATRESKEVKQGIAEAFERLDKDESVTGFGVTPSLHDPEPVFEVPRDQFPIIAGGLRDESARSSEQRVTLQVVRAILERSKRLWEFIWQGNRIAAPVLDEEFYDSLARRTVSLGIGDTLDVTLRVKQKPIPDTDLLENVGYEVLKVHRHTPRPTQSEVRPL